MADVSSIKLPNNSTYDIKDSTARTKIGNMADKLVYPVIGTQTAATAQFTGTIDVDQLYDGLTIAYYLPYAGVSGTNATMNLTLSDGTTTGAIDIYETGTTRLTTHYTAGSTIILTYWSAGSISVSGTATTSARWTHADYNADANSIGYQLRHNSGTYTAFANIYRYMLLLSKSSTQVLPVNSVSNSIATTKALTTENFNPFGEILYYSGTATVAAGSQTVSSLWQQYAFDLRYSFNCGQTLTSNKDVYIVAVPQSDGYAKLASSPLAQDLPNTDDGKIYIYLGHAYSTYQIEMHMNHPVYWYKDGKICLYTKNDVYVAGNDITLTSTTNNNEIKIAAKLQKYWKTSISKTPYSNELEVSTTFSSTISNSSTDPHPSSTDQISLVGASVGGKQYTIDGETITAGTGAEVFNEYSGATENIAVGDYSHAEGSGTTAIGMGSHAEGGLNVAEGAGTHAEGAYNTAKGDYSHVEGYRCQTNGDFSHAEGRGTVAYGDCQHVEGKYNVHGSGNNLAFIIGNGTGLSDTSNAFAIDWDGKIYTNNASTGIDVNKLAGKVVDDGAKNLLKIMKTSQTINGVTFTVNDDGTVTANGTNSSTTSSATFVIVPYQEADKIPNGSYRLTGCPSSGSSTTYDLRWYLYSPGKSAYDTGSGAVIEKNGIATGSGGIAIVVKARQTVNNVVFKPMICTLEDYAISSEYVPYARSNYQLTKDVGSIPKLIDDGAKNLLKNTAPYGDIVKTNITFTHNDDDTYAVNANSANTAITDLYVATNIPIKAGTYVLSGCPEGGNNSNTYKLQIAGIGYDLGDGFTFTIAQETTISVYIRIWSGYVPNDLIFRPMICTAENHAASDSFVPYTPTLRELYEMVLALQNNS